MKKTIVCLAVAIAVMFSLTQAFAADVVVIKKGDNITVYNIYNYSESNMTIDVSTLTSPTVATLANLGVPSDAWPMCANYRDGYYSTIVLNAESNSQQLKTDLDNEKEWSDSVDSERTLYKTLFIISLVVGGVVIAILAINLSRANKRK